MTRHQTLTNPASGIDRANARAAQIAARPAGYVPQFTLVDVVAAEVPNLADRYARRQALRDLLWAAVSEGTYADFDDALAAYATNRF